MATKAEIQKRVRTHLEKAIAGTEMIRDRARKRGSRRDRMNGVLNLLEQARTEFRVGR